MLVSCVHCRVDFQLEEGFNKVTTATGDVIVDCPSCFGTISVTRIEISEDLFQEEQDKLLAELNSGVYDDDDELSVIL